jgi:hypothetical protein
VLGVRRKLLVPNRENPKRVQINDFVLDLFQELDYHRLMWTYHILQSFPKRNQENLYVKLGHLFDNEYLGRNYNSDYRKPGSAALFWWLRPKAKYILAREDRPYTGDIDYDPDPPKL